MELQFDLNDVRCFALIAKAGSITRAASQFDTPKATLSHHLRRLEDALEVELFIRRSRGLELTDAGKELLAHSQAIFEACDVASSAVKRTHADHAGKLRVVASSAFGTSFIGAAAARAAVHNDQIDFDVQLYPNDKLIAGQFEFDCMVVVGEPPIPSLRRRNLGGMSFGLYASPLLVERCGAPDHPDDVGAYDGIVLTQGGIDEAWNLRSDGRSLRVQPHTRFRVNEYWMAKFFAVEGLAIGYLPNFFVQPEVVQGALVPLLPAWRSDDIPVYAVYPAVRRENARIEQFLDVMASQFDDIISDPGYRAARIDYGQPTITSAADRTPPDPPSAT